MSKSSPSLHAIRSTDLRDNSPRNFEILPDSAARTAIAAELGLSELRKLRFVGTLTPDAKSDWRLNGTLGATVVQPCTVTLTPVTTRIDATVHRLYLRDYEEPEGEEVEMPEDDDAERLGHWIDPEAVMLEALALEIPTYPRGDDAAFESASFAEDGVIPMSDEDAKPFAGLAALRDQMDKDDPS